MHFAAGDHGVVVIGVVLTLHNTIAAVRAWRSDRPRSERPRGPVHHGAGSIQTTWDGGLVHVHIKTDTGVEWTSVMEPDAAERSGAAMMVAATYARGEVREAGWHAPNGARVIIWPAGKLTKDGATIDVAPDTTKDDAPPPWGERA